MIREALHVKYGHLNNAVGLGGVIVQEKGKSLYHVLVSVFLYFTKFPTVIIFFP